MYVKFLKKGEKEKEEKKEKNNLKMCEIFVFFQPKTTTLPVVEKQNPIGSAVLKILSFRQTDRLTDGQTDRHSSTLYYR